MHFNTPKEAETFIDDTWSASSVIRQALGYYTFVNRGFVEGVQWIGGGTGIVNPGDGSRPLATNWNPDSGQLTATVNHTTKLIHRTAAAGFMDRLELEIYPGDRDTGIEAAMRAGVMESVTNAMVDCTGYVAAAREANYRRCVDGTYCMAWDVVVKNRTIKLRRGGETTVQDQVLKAFTFPSTELTLDPLNQKLDLHEHEYVIHSKVWPVEKLRRMLGVTIDENELQTCGELVGADMNYSAQAGNRLYANMAMYSRTKGARVFQVHRKDEHGRFATMLLGYRAARQTEMVWINFDNQDTPFGGCGLPMVMFHGHRRPDSMWSVSDVAMLKDYQIRMNLLNTFYYRILQQYSHVKVRVPIQPSVGQDAETWKDQYNNRIGGPWFYNTGTKDRPLPPPDYVQQPAPPAFLQGDIRAGAEEMADQVGRPGITSGDYKTHTTNETFQTALQGANQVLGGRTKEDLTRHAWMLTVGLGTIVKLAQDGSPSILGELQRSGLDEADFAIVAQADPYYPVAEIRIRESSIKYESAREKEDRLWKAVQLQTVTDPSQIRMALAGLGIPLDEDDKDFFNAAQRVTSRILLGEEWQPFQLGDRTTMFVTQFRRAMFDKRAMSDPETRARLDRAITAQMQFDLMQKQAEAMAANPEPAQPQPEQPQAQAAPEGPSEADLGQLLQAIQTGSEQPQPVAA